MFNKFVVSIILLFTFSKNEIFSAPIDNILKPFQITTDSTVLNNQGFEKQINRNAARNRKKRFLDDFVEFVSLIEDYFYSDEDEDSCEQTINIRPLLRPIKGQEFFMTSERPQTKPTTQNVALELDGDLELGTTTETETKIAAEVLEKPVSTIRKQEEFAKRVSIITEASSSTTTTTTNPMRDLTVSPTTTQVITTAVEVKEE